MLEMMMMAIAAGAPEPTLIETIAAAVQNVPGYVWALLGASIAWGWANADPH